MKTPFKMKGHSLPGPHQASPTKHTRVYKTAGHGYSKKDVRTHNRQKATKGHEGPPHGPYTPSVEEKEIKEEVVDVNSTSTSKPTDVPIVVEEEEWYARHSGDPAEKGHFLHPGKDQNINFNQSMDDNINIRQSDLLDPKIMKTKNKNRVDMGLEPVVKDKSGTWTSGHSK